MKRTIAFFLSWLFYVAGDLTSRILNWWPDRWETTGYALATFYQWSMRKSFNWDNR